jgi:hypothetical protein
VSVRAGLLVMCAAAVVAAAPAQAKAPVRARVALKVEDRTGYDYRWEYNVAVRATARGTGAPLRKLRVDVVGSMSIPGHSMQTVPVRFASHGDGTYTGKLAFYMPGNWTIRVTVAGTNVVKSTTRFSVYLDPATPAP